AGRSGRGTRAPWRAEPARGRVAPSARWGRGSRRLRLTPAEQPAAHQRRHRVGRGSQRGEASAHVRRGRGGTASDATPGRPRVAGDGRASRARPAGDGAAGRPGAAGDPRAEALQPTPGRARRIGDGPADLAQSGPELVAEQVRAPLPALVALLVAALALHVQALDAAPELVLPLGPQILVLLEVLEVGTRHAQTVERGVDVLVVVLLDQAVDVRVKLGGLVLPRACGVAAEDVPRDPAADPGVVVGDPVVRPLTQVAAHGPGRLQAGAEARHDGAWQEAGAAQRHGAT